MNIETEYKGVKLPAKMLCWDYGDTTKNEEFVIAYVPDATTPVKTVDSLGVVCAWEYAKPIPEKKMRVMTAEELKGKWVKRKDDCREYQIASINHSFQHCFISGYADEHHECWMSIQRMHENGFVLADRSSLMVEDES